LDVDVYVYLGARQTLSSVKLPENRPICVAEVEAVACVPKHAEYLSNVKVGMEKWLNDGDKLGATSQLLDGKKPIPTEPPEGLFIPGKTVEATASKEPPAATADGPKDELGCYLIYDADGCKLIQHYSKKYVPGAIGFYSPGPGQKIPGFKFTSNQGRAELIGNCSGGVVGRKNYYSGWCQFVRAAKAMQGNLRIYPRYDGQPGLDVDLYTYAKNPQPGLYQTEKIQVNTMWPMENFDAVACLPKHAEFFEGLTMDLTRWVEEGSKIGATIQV
jgi:Immune Mapped Protein 2 (IMP2) N-terminal domain